MMSEGSSTKNTKLLTLIFDIEISSLSNYLKTLISLARKGVTS